MQASSFLCVERACSRGHALYTPEVFVINGKPAGEAQHQTCFACHQANVKNHDLVFTRLAP
jgi:hypothetical protein